MRGGRHGGVEGVAADDLVQVGGGDYAGVYEGVQTVDDELRTLEAEHGCLGGLAGDVLR